MKTEQGEAFSLDKVNLAELERRTGISRAKLRRLKDQGFTFKDHGRKGFKAKKTVLSGYEDAIDKFLANGVSNSSVIFERIKEEGYAGGLTTVKDYIASHKHLLPPKRQVVSSQGNRGRRYKTAPGEAYQMDWGFVHVENGSGGDYMNRNTLLSSSSTDNGYLFVLDDSIPYFVKFPAYYYIGYYIIDYSYILDNGDINDYSNYLVCCDELGLPTCDQITEMILD